MKYLRMKYIFIEALFFILILTTISNAKYVIETNTLAAVLNIDRTKPEGVVTYSTEKPTIEDVVVTINISEPIKEVEGWLLSEDKTKLSKTFNENQTTQISIYDMSNNKNDITININNIDRKKPDIKVLSVTNTNTNYIQYANKTHTITVKIQITDDYIENKIDVEKINVFVGNSINECSKVIKNVKQIDKGIECELEISNIINDGLMKVLFLNGFVTDEAGNISQELEFNTNIKIDNINPEGNVSQDKLENGKIKATLTSNESIIPIDEWEKISNQVFTKIFPSNVSYSIKIKDFAQNESEIDIAITDATYILFDYAAHNSEIGWTYGLGNYDIAGRTAIIKDPALKIEALAFRISGKVDKDFVKIKGFINSFWNNLSDYGRCNNTGFKYKVRVAPSSSGNMYYTMNSNDLSTIDGKKYIQLGGAGINQINNRDYNGNYPITRDAIYNSDIKYPYGVSEIEIHLKEYSELSVVYQILIDGKGWIKTKLNGEVASVSRNIPITAIRTAIIPNSEVDSIIETWDKDIGTYKTY